MVEQMQMRRRPSQSQAAQTVIDKGKSKLTEDLMKTLMNALALLATVLSGSISIEGNASIIYDWQGECRVGCTGEATGLFTLPDSYVPGTRFDCALCQVPDVLSTATT